jgi:hypothetical protein
MFRIKFYGFIERLHVPHTESGTHTIHTAVSIHHINKVAFFIF